MPAGEIADLIGGVIIGVQENNRIAAAAELFLEVADDVDRRIERAQPGRILGHDEVAAGRDGFARGKLVTDPAAQLPAGQVNGIAAAVIEFEPRLRRWLGGRGGRGGHQAVMVHDFVDHDFVMEREAVRPAGSGLVGIQPRPDARRQPAAQRGFYHDAIDHLVLGRRQNEKFIARRRMEAQLCLSQRQIIAGRE